MKMFTWISSLIFVGVLSGCGDSADQSSIRSADLAVSKMAAVQVALDQVVDARDAIKKADNDKVLAVEEAEKMRAAVRQAINNATKESEALKKDAAIRASWSQKTHDQAVATRRLLLQAAMEQSDAKLALLEKEKKLMEIRILDDLHQHDAKVAMLGQLKAEKMLAVVIEAERLASLSIDLVVPNSAAGKQMHANVEKSTATTTAPITAAIIKKTAVKFAKKSTPPPTHKTVKHTVNKKVSKSIVKLAKAPSPHSENASRGRDLTKKCQSCHTFGPNQKAKLGPNLFGVVGQQAGKSQNFKYGSALAKADFTWDEKNLTEWICHSGKTIKNLTGNPYASTRMSAQKICGQDAKDVVAYLRTLKTQASAKSTTGS